MFHSISVLFTLFLFSYKTNANPIHDPKNVPNLFNLPGMLENNRTDINIIQGDIAIPAGTSRTAYTAAPRWPGGVVPYEFDGVFSDSQRHVIIGAMNTITQNTGNCIRFTNRNGNDPYVRIISAQGCWSHMGKVVDSGAQELSLQMPGCVHHSVAIHEFLHALGTAHEHARPDRDNYVQVHFENVEPGMEYAFDKYGYNQVNFYNEAYDYGSIMMYPSDAFSKNGRATIRPSLAGYEGWEHYMGRGDQMSAQDITKLKRYYGCA